MREGRQELRSFPRTSACYTSEEFGVKCELCCRCIERKMALASAFIRLLPMAMLPFLALGNPTSRVSPNQSLQEATELTHKIINAFNISECQDALTLVGPNRYTSLSALALAIVSFCQPSPILAEPLFEQAERIEPSNDKIVLLHARYRWKRDPESSVELWKRVVLLARDNQTKILAQEYIQGHGTGQEKIEVEAPLGYYGSILFGPTYDSNPLFARDSGNIISDKSVFLLWDTGVQYLLPMGTMNVNYAGNYNYFFNLSQASSWKNDFEFPFALRAGTNEDLKFRPFGSFQLVANRPYYQYYGFGVVGVAFRAHYRQSLQGSVFKDIYFQTQQEQQEGTHFKFEYIWETYRADWLLRFNLSVEHVAAGHDRDDSLGSIINYSHNDLALQTLLELRTYLLTFGLYSRLNARQDDLDSTFIGQGGSLITKRRQDFLMLVQPSITYPITQEWQIFSFARFLSNLSNFGPEAGSLDKKYSEWAVGMAVRWITGNI